MELLRRHVAVQPTRYAAYVALQVALMRRFLARGGTLEDFCARLAPAFHQRFGAVIALEVGSSHHSFLAPCSARLVQEYQGLQVRESTREMKVEIGSVEAA